jgi:DNA-binding response OmpR family regulator
MDAVYQGGRSADADSGTVRIALCVEVPAGPAWLVQHALDLVAQYGDLIGRSVPGAAVRTATTSTAPRSSGLAIDRVRRVVTLDGRPIRLAYREFELLDYLRRADGRTVSRAELLAQVWRAGVTPALSERTIDSHVRRLRAKLGPHAGMLTAVRGVGYRLTTGGLTAESA